MTSVVRILSIPIALALMASGCAPESQRVRTPSTNNSPLSIPPQECSAPEEEGSFAQSEAEFEKWSTGVWLLCKPPSIFQTSESGMEISNDGTWWKLVQDSSGQLVRLERWEQRGSWDVFDTSAMNGPGHFELNFSVDGSGAHFTQPKFFSDASRMRINNHGVEADYVRTMRGTAPAPAESPAHHEVSPECSAVEGGVARAYTRDDFIRRILGKWLLCGPPSVFGSQEAGLEIGNEGRWWKLVRNETGELKRSAGQDNEGSWEVIDTSSMNGPGVWQLNLIIDGVGDIHTQPQFAAKTSKMRYNNGAHISDYVRS